MASLWPISTWTEPVTRVLGRSQQLNRLGKWVGNTFHRLVGTGPVKDLLAGTWMGHPLHPLLTDVTIGAWTSATILDLVGGERARPGADTLIGVGILSALPTAVSGLSDLTDVVEDDDRSVGTAHALTNVAGLALWRLAYLVRRGGRRRRG